MKTFLSSITALLIALGAGLLTAGLTGGDPVLVVQALIHGAFGTEANIAGTLSKSVPLMLTGLSVAIAFRTGLFNIGGEGQLYAGALAAAWLGGLGLDLSPYLYLPIVILAASIAGGIMGFIPGWLKARRGVHEVINTIMLNYIAIQTADFLVNGPLSSEVYSARTKALAQFKCREVSVLVATDIAARGLDIVQLPHVVNYDLPNVPEDYVHRIGRTGRAGEKGQAVSLVSQDEFPFLVDIEQLIKKILPRKVLEGVVKKYSLPASSLDHKPLFSKKKKGQQFTRSKKKRFRPKRVY